MKTKNIIIAILVVVILGQFFLLLRQTRIQRYIDFVNKTPQRIRIPIEVYVAGLTESINQNRQANIELLVQSQWAIRHLGQCVKLLEKERGLDPIPMKFEHYPLPDSNHPMMPLVPPNKQESGPFYLPCEKPSIHEEPNHPEEGDLNRLRCMLNLNTVSLKLASAGIEQQIHNYEERLQRLDPNQP
jgi:hypothetical protein